MLLALCYDMGQESMAKEFLRFQIFKDFILYICAMTCDMMMYCSSITKILKQTYSTQPCNCNVCHLVCTVRVYWYLAFYCHTSKLLLNESVIVHLPLVHHGMLYIVYFQTANEEIQGADEVMVSYDL